MTSKGTGRTVLMNDTELETVFATGQSVRPVLERILSGANARRTGKTVGPTTSFQNVSECEARQIPTDPHRSPPIPTALSGDPQSTTVHHRPCVRLY